MYVKNRILSVLLAIVLSFSLTTTALAATPSPEVLKSPPADLVDHPVTAAEATSLLSKLNETANDLHLSTSSLMLQAGKYYKVQILPSSYAKPLGWQLTKVELSDLDLAEVCAEAPEGVEVISTLPSDASDLTGAELQSVVAISEEEPAETLSFVIKALRTGRLELRVTLQNPIWQWLEPDNPQHTQTLVSERYESARLQAANRRDDDDNDDSSFTDSITKPSNPTEPSEPNEPGDPEQPPVTPDEPNQPQPDPEPNPEPDPKPDDPKPPVLQEYDTSAWVFDPNSLQFTYDGQAHQPVLTGVPDDVKVTFSVQSVEGTGDAVNAGSYTIKATFEVPEGYKPVADFSTNFTIDPARIQFSQVFDRETGTVVPVISGVVSGDVADVTTSVNGESLDNSDPVAVGNPGSYTVSTSVAITDGKEGNYVFDDASSQTTLVNTENSNSWFKITMDGHMKDGNLVIDFNMADLKTEQVGTTKAAGLEFTLDYDHDRLEYVETNREQGYWHMFYASSQDKEYAYYYGNTGPLPENATICHLTFKLKEGASADDLIITVRDAKVTAAPIGNDAMNFIYTSADTAIVVNPTGDINVETIVVEGNPMDDVIYRYEDRLHDSNGNPVLEEIAKKEAEIAKLEEYVKEKFPNSAPTAASLDQPIDADVNAADVSTDTGTDDQPARLDEATDAAATDVVANAAVEEITDADESSDGDTSADANLANPNSDVATSGDADLSNDGTDDQGSVVTPAPSTPADSQFDTTPASDLVVTAEGPSSHDSTESQNLSDQASELAA